MDLEVEVAITVDVLAVLPEVLLQFHADGVETALVAGALGGHGAHVGGVPLGEAPHLLEGLFDVFEGLVVVGQTALDLFHEVHLLLVGGA